MSKNLFYVSFFDNFTVSSVFCKYSAALSTNQRSSWALQSYLEVTGTWALLKIWNTMSIALFRDNEKLCQSLASVSVKKCPLRNGGKWVGSSMSQWRKNIVTKITHLYPPQTCHWPDSQSSGFQLLNDETSGIRFPSKSVLSEMRVFHQNCSTIISTQ